MNLSDPLDPPASLALRVGCSLEYHVDAPAPILLKIEPYPMSHRVFIDQKLSIGNESAVERRQDCHGNAILSAVLTPGLNRIRYDAILHVGANTSSHDTPLRIDAGRALPAEVSMYTFPSRYCESDKLIAFATNTFASFPAGLARAQAICDWTHQHIEYRYGSGDASLSACEAIDRGYGVCRDFAHVMIALCRAVDMPARYVAGYVPLLAGCVQEFDIGIDFHAYVEVYVNSTWHLFDPRHARLYPSHVKIAQGMDAIDAAFATFSGVVTPLKFQVWAYELDLSVLRLEDAVLSLVSVDN
jgi:transglutaminase-like putative cysteine protease